MSPRYAWLALLLAIVLPLGAGFWVFLEMASGGAVSATPFVVWGVLTIGSLPVCVWGILRLVDEYRRTKKLW